MNEYVMNGAAFGSIAARLLAANFSPRVLRPYTLADGRCVVANARGDGVEMVHNASLGYDDWKQIDNTVQETLKSRLTVVNMLVRRGLVYNMGNGMGKTVLQSDAISGMTAASLSMIPAVKGPGDSVAFEPYLLPLPIASKPFTVDIRTLNNSRSGGTPLDTAGVSAATRVVAEAIEDSFCANQTFPAAGGTVYSLVNQPDRNTVNLTTAWSDPGVDGDDVLADVLEMKQAALNDSAYGPYALLVPAGWSSKLDTIRNATSDKTTRQCILEIEGIQECLIAPRLPADEAVLVQLTPDVIQVVDAMAVTPLQWETDGGMLQHFLVAGIQVPRIRADYNGASGVVHLRAAVL